jgi:hypothetical protein
MRTRQEMIDRLLDEYALRLLDKVPDTTPYVTSEEEKLQHLSNEDLLIAHAFYCGE